MTFKEIEREPWLTVCSDCSCDLHESFEYEGHWFWNWRRSAKKCALCTHCYHKRWLQVELAKEMYGKREVENG